MERKEIQYHVIKEGMSEDDAQLIMTVATQEDGTIELVFPDLVDPADIFDDDE